MIVETNKNTSTGKYEVDIKTTGVVAELEANKEVSIDVSNYSEPVEITPSSGKDGMEKATVTLTNISSGGGGATVYFGSGTDNYNSEGVLAVFSKKGSEYSIGETVTTTVIYYGNHNIDFSVVSGTIQEVDGEKKFVNDRFETKLPEDEDYPINKPITIG